MKKTTYALAMFGFLSACNKTTPEDQALMESVRKACECQDRACATEAKGEVIMKAMHVKLRDDQAIMDGIIQHLDAQMPEAEGCIRRMFELSDKGSMAEQFDDLSEEAMGGAAKGRQGEAEKEGAAAPADGAAMEPAAEATSAE